MSAVPGFEPLYDAPKLHFRLQSLASTSDDTCRRGELSFEGANEGNDTLIGKTRQLQTPALIVHTRRGAVPHLTRDNISRMPIEMMHISLEHLLETIPPNLSQTPFSLHRFFGVHSTANHNQQLLTMSLRDFFDKTTIASNGDHEVVVTGFRGVRKIKPADYIKYSLARPPDILFAPSDDPVGDDSPSNRRIEKSVRRTLQWLTEIQSEIKGRTNVFAPLMGATSLSLRSIFSKSLAGESSYAGSQKVVQDGEKALDTSFAGYTLSIPPILTDSKDPTTVSSLLRTSLSPLPKTKPRAVVNACGPHDILRLVKDTGIDLFLDEWTSQCSSAGIGLDFQFPVGAFPIDKAHLKSPNKIDIGHNYYDTKFERAFEPLSNSTLARYHPPTRLAGPDSFSKPTKHPFGPMGPPTRGYVHHLLHAHEMTSHVILALHNQIMMHNFMASIRLLLESGDPDQFAQEVDKFFNTYEESIPFTGGKYQCLQEGQENWKIVNKARGKGSLKEKLMADAAMVAESPALESIS